MTAKKAKVAKRTPRAKPCPTCNGKRFVEVDSVAGGGRIRLTLPCPQCARTAGAVASSPRRC